MQPGTESLGSMENIAVNIPLGKLDDSSGKFFVSLAMWFHFKPRNFAFVLRGNFFEAVLFYSKVAF